MKTPRRLSLSLSLCLLSSAALLGCGSDRDPKELVASARSYIEQNDFKAATIQLKNALQQSPDLAEARVLLGRALLDQGDVVGAEVQANKALELGSVQDEAVPLMAAVLLAQGKAEQVVQRYATTALAQPRAKAALQTTLAQAWLAQGKREQGEAALKAALEADAEHVQARLLQARLQAAAPDLPGARKLVDEVLQKHPKSYEAWLLQAALAQAAEDADAAAKAYQQALAARKDGLGAHAGYIGLLNAQKKFEEADKQIAQLKSVLPDHPQTKLLEAQSTLRRGDLKTSRELVQAVLKVAPSHPYALQLAGTVEYESGNFAQAIAHLGKAQSLVPDSAPTRQLLAQALLRTGDTAKALSVLQPLLDDKNASTATLGLAAQAYQQSGDLERAEALYKRAAAQDPNDKRARVALALNRLARGDASALETLQATAADDKGTTADLALINERMRRREFDAALQAIDALEKKVPGQALAPLLRARAQLALKQPDKARQSLEQAVKAEPTNLQAAMALAELDVRDKQFDAARKRFDAVLKADARNAGALLAVARIRQAAGAPASEVRSMLEDAVRANPDDQNARVMLVEHHLGQKDNSAALAAAQEAVAALPDNAAVLAELARVQAISGDFNQSVSSLGQVAAKQPNSVQAQLMLADVQLAAKNYDAAIGALERARALAPTDFGVAQRLAGAQLAASRPAQALATARALQKEKDMAAAGLVLEGDVEAAQKHGREATAAYRAALAKQPASTAIAVKLHGALIMQEDKAGASAFATKWLADHPQDGGFVFHLSEVALAQRDYAQAEARLSDALKLRPDDPVVLNNLAWVQVQLKRPTAVETAEKANKLRPDTPAFLDTLALALAANKQWDRAIEIQKKVVAQDKDPAWRLALAKLYMEAGQRAQARTELDALAQLGKDFRSQDEVQKLLREL
ncbi:XrtA/PEP-CTERM system TPR-repeat protein PrsT [Azohydromonas caseinilytica]|uniref:PEP-CTERM system TPR-repeat protein PrsT n=1 Tax=Azohydromonas caseinilytica TaxID=2728836 RepID=A0A848FIA4_9BURK|nr:XrtA/PEP-CTERM system TPR-repeat protein PrsT [Azohydromonas caseinilytica]NML17983.1 PEP-CTERM system TPR-repeat protein PrsT [Azohydromonas caseinilytica]